MFPSFISILDIQSWWEVPSIAHFCSLFRAAFNLLDFDIEELEEALLTDGTEDSGSSLLQELIVRLLCGCLANNDVSTFNYQMFLRRLFRQKCQEHGRYNPFNTDIDFQFLPLRTKVEILHALCDFRLDADDVLDLLKNLEAESLRVEPLGYDDNDSAYWYFYGTRLYREDYEKGSKKSKHKKSVWQVVCFTEQDWNHLTLKFKGATSKTEKALYRSLSENFLPEIPRLFQEKERQQRKRLLELQPRRSSSRVQKLRAQHEEEFNNEITAAIVQLAPEDDKTIKADIPSARELRAIQRDACKSGSGSGSGSGSESESCTQTSTTMPTQKTNSGLTSVGRQTNNSLASATGQILIQTSSQRKKLKTSQVFRQTEEDLQTGMYKILEYVKNHDDAWPFIEPVEEDYAPNYYSIVRKPMDLQRMEDKLDAGEYLTFSRFKADFQLIVDNCRLYNGTDNEYTEMVDNLQQAFQRATDRFLDQITSSDEEIAVEFQGSSKENVTINKKPKRGRKENKATVKRNSSPSCIEAKPSKVMRKKHNKLKNSPLLTNNDTDKKIKQTKKEKNKHKDKDKDKDKDKNTVLNVNSNISPRKNNKKKNSSQNSVAAVERDKSRSRTRSRSRSNIRGWTSSPSPPPPRIQKKKKNKEKITKLSTPIENNVNVDNTDKVELKEIKISEQPKNQKKIFTPENESIKKENSQLNETIEKLKKNNLAKKEHVVNKKQKIRDKNKERLKKLKAESKEKVKENKVAMKSDSEEMETESTHTRDSSTTFSDSKKIHPKKVKKAGIIKNPAAIKALDLATEQTLKDINKWLDDTPKFSELNSPSTSPLPLTNLDDFDVAASNLETEYKLNQQKQIQKQVTPVPPVPTVVKAVKEAKDTFKRRPPHKDVHKLQKRRDFQRTIDRLQPGKSKGNLIANIQSNKTEDPTFPPITTLNKLKETKNATPAVDKESTPKLSLGTVLDSFGQQHNFVDNKKELEPTTVNVVENELKKEDDVETVEKDTDGNTKLDKETTTTEEDSNVPLKLPKQENVTPNLSAWFKAFGAPKSSSVQKKKTDPELDTSKEAENVVSPISADENRLSKPNCELVDDTKKMSSPMPSPAPDITIGLQPVPRMRKASTGSTVSERSSFSQDMTDPLDSPRLSVDERLGMYSAPYPSPLHRSPIGVSPVRTSPHMDDGQRSASYPPLNANIRVGFYQDTVKSSPEKSCSPRDQSQSPHPQYSQHVYIPPSSSTYQYNNPPSQSPVYSQSPAQSPVHSQSGVPPPPYNSNHMIGNTFFEANKPMEYESVKSPCGNNIPPTSAMSPPGSPKQFENGNNAQSQRTVENKTHMNTIIPVKKRLYNENPDVEQISRLSSPLPPPPRDLNIQNIPRIHEMNIFSNREIDSNLIPTEHMNLPNPEQLNIPNKTAFLPGNAQTLETSLSSTVAKNFISTNTLCDISNRTLDNTHIINVANRGLNLQIPSTEPLNIPTPMKTIDLTGPDSPVYQHTMNMPLEIGTIKHNSRTTENLYQKIPSSAPSNIEMAQIPQYSRHDEKSLLAPKTHDAVSQTESLPSVSSTVAFSAGRPVSVDLNMHNSRINLASADLRIPTMRPETVPQNSNQEINTAVSQRNEFSHQNLRGAAESRLSLPSGINIELTGNSVSNSHAFNNPTTIGLDPTLALRGNLANLSNIMDRYQNDERILSTLATATGNPYYTDKGLVTAQSLFPKTIPTSIHTPVSNTTSSHSILSQPNLHINSTSSINYATSTQSQQPQQTVKSTSSVATLSQTDKKIKKRKSKTSSPVTTVTDVNAGFQTYPGLKSNPGTVVSTEPSAISLKTASVVPGSAFNFGPASTNLGLTTDNFSGFLDEYRNPTTNYYMAAAAAVVHHGSTPEINTDKSQRSVAPPAPNPSSSTFTYLGHPQTRPTTYSPFINPHQPPLIETSSPLYQQYLQRHQEELLRHSGVLHQSLLGSPTAYPPGYPLGMRQPFDTINRPSWL